MRFKLANVLFGGSRFFTNYPTMLYRVSSGAVECEDDFSVLRLSDSTVLDFTTYFNALSVYKWKKYSICDNFHLHVEYKGSFFTLIETFADNGDWDSHLVDETSRSFDASDEWTCIDIELSSNRHEVVQSFLIRTEGELRLRNAYYYAEVIDSSVRPVELALATTTFKKENYVTRNIDLIKQKLLASDELVASHFTVHVIDNGRTLQADDIAGEHVYLHPNPNVGGSGGFARGMIEALEQTPKATHVLLMDDDVEVLPESFIRVFNLLSLAKDKYAEAFVSGAMMSLEEPNLRTEDLGFFTQNGNFSPLKPSGYMTDLHDVVETEIYRAPVKEWADTSQQYAGWWFCVIPVSIIEREGLPLPLFVRSDDAEYALRCKPKFMSMNGICVWHNAFFYKYSAAVERYQVSRNTLISQATTGVAPLTDFIKEIKHEVQLDLKKFNYDDALLAVKGLEDFLRGPEFIAHPVAEGRFMDANREKEKLSPIDDLYDEALSLGVDLKQLNHSNLNLDGPRSKMQALKDFVTFNGQRFVDESAKRKGNVAVIDAAGWVYPASRIREAGTIIAVDMPNNKAVIRHMDKARFKEVWGRFKKAEKEYRKNKERLFAEYAAHRDDFTSIDFWKRYLKEASEK